MRRSLTIALALLLSCAALALAACGGSSDPNAITVYSGQHEQTTAMLVAAFERQTGIKVNLRSGDEAALGNQLLQEGSSSPADVFYSENTPVLESLAEHSLLTPAAPATLAAVPARYSSAKGLWVGVSARASTLVYNPSKLGSTPLPHSILELAGPQWKGKLGFAPSETDFQPLVAAIERTYGQAAAERWLKGVQANGTVYPDNETAAVQVNNGESAAAPVNHYYWYRMREELGAGRVHSALHYYAPGDVGAVLDVSGAAVLASSDRKADAQRFLAFLVSAAGQEAIARSHSYEYPLRSGVAPAAGLVPLAQIKPAPLTPAELGDGSKALELEQKLGLL
jgi:iron(III) transport system substrate-binding protein